MLQNSCSEDQDKLQDKKQATMDDISKLGKVYEMLDEDIFWYIVDKSVTESNSQEEQEKILINEITKLPLKDIIGFRLRTDKLLFDTYNSEMWCAGYLMNQGCSDDGFEYFRNWIISRGKETYYNAETNPDSLISQIEHKAYGFYEFEGFWYVALEAFKTKTGQELYDYIDYDNFKTREGNYPNFEFTWKEKEPESMKAICPKLYKEFWN
ncbi:DUF4240 domain-containing protein [Winogradskyella sp.]|uniref:DUF4240 domain-containing protein n=1 Tax=Winogradskyella sp. TaxID=1883156 RepID=UPI002616C8D4|nr:DUF4240 domain-containing protein [Winogradskyella sp.]